MDMDDSEQEHELKPFALRVSKDTENGNVGFEDQPKSRHKVTNYRQNLCALLALIHFISCGIPTAFCSIMLAQLKEDEEIEITTEQASWIVSIYLMPMAPASIITGIVTSKVPKRSLLMFITLLEVIGWLAIYFCATSSIPGILVGRFLTGVAGAMGSPIIPSFLGEVTHPSVRSLYISTVFLGLSVGILVIHLMGAFLKWTTCILVSISLLLIFFALSWYLKESYVWYLKKNDVIKAKEAFYWYRGHDEDAKQEIKRLIEKQDENVTSNRSNWEFIQMCCTRLLLMPLSIIFTVMATTLLSGHTVIAFYSISIMESVIPKLNKYMSTIIVDVLRLVMTIAGSFIIGKFPVRKVLLTSGYGSALAHFAFAIFKFISKSVEDDTLFSILTLVSLIVYMVFATCGLASLAWVIFGEIFPLAVKGIGCGLALFLNFVVFFLVIKFSPLLEASFGIAVQFLFYGCCTLIGTTILYFIMPETRNKTLKEIEELFRK